MNDVAQSLRSDTLCGFCHRPWFGSVAYCPYCGRRAAASAVEHQAEEAHAVPEAVAEHRASVAKAVVVDVPPAVEAIAEDRAQAPAAIAEDRAPAGEAVANEPDAWWMGADGMRLRPDPVGQEELPDTPMQGLATPDRDRPGPSQRGNKALKFLFKTAVVAVTALLLLWVAVEFFADRDDEAMRTAAQPMGAPAAQPMGAPPAPPAAPAPTVPARAVSAPAIPPRADTAAPPSANRSLCSAAHEKAGLCKSQ